MSELIGARFITDLAVAGIEMKNAELAALRAELEEYKVKLPGVRGQLERAMAMLDDSQARVLELERDAARLKFIRDYKLTDGWSWTDDQLDKQIAVDVAIASATKE